MFGVCLGVIWVGDVLVVDKKMKSTTLVWDQAESAHPAGASALLPPLRRWRALAPIGACTFGFPFGGPPLASQRLAMMASATLLAAPCLPTELATACGGRCGSGWVLFALEHSTASTYSSPGVRVGGLWLGRLRPGPTCLTPHHTTQHNTQHTPKARPRS